MNNVGLFGATVVEEVGDALARGAQFEVGFNEMQEKHADILLEHRGRGLMRGLQFTSESHGPRMSYQLAHNGVMALYSGNEPSVMRLMPSLVISEGQTATVLEALDRSMQVVKDQDAGKVVHQDEPSPKRRLN